MKPDELLGHLREALREVDELLNKGTFDEGKEGFPTSSELSLIRQELHRVEMELLNKTVPEKEHRTLSIGRIVLDGWWKYDQDPLARKLVAIADAYKRKLTTNANAR